jgi:hypothetical protein
MILPGIAIKPFSFGKEQDENLFDGTVCVRAATQHFDGCMVFRSRYGSNLIGFKQRIP